MLARIALVTASIALLPATLAAQTAPHIEIAGTLADVAIEPVYFKPLAALGTGPSTPARVDRWLDVATPGIDIAVYLGSRVQGIVRRSLVPERTGDPPPLPPLPLPPPGPGPTWQALIVRSTERLTRVTLGAAVDVSSRRRVRVAVGGGLHVDRVTGTQTEWMIAFRTGLRPTPRDDFKPVTLKTPVVLGRVKIYPWKHLLTFADVSIRLTSATGERALYEAARVTPGMGVGVTF